MSELLGNGITVSVPPRHQAAFMAEGAHWYWMFKRQPACADEETITFTVNRKPVAQARIFMVARPGQVVGRTPVRWWRVFWWSGTWHLLADPDEEGFQPLLYGGYTPEARQRMRQRFAANGMRPELTV